MKVGILCNRQTKKFLPIRDGLFKVLEVRGVGYETYYAPQEIASPDILVVLGGDGTILKAAIEAGIRGIDLLGIGREHRGNHVLANDPPSSGMGTGTLAFSGVSQVNGHVILCAVAAGHSAVVGGVAARLHTQDLFVLKIFVATVGRLPTGKG